MRTALSPDDAERQSSLGWSYRIRDPCETIHHFKEKTMATFINLATFTDQGIKNIKESPDRLDAFRAMAEKLGMTVKGAYYTLGQYDMVVIVEGPEESGMATLLKLGSLGNVRSQTLRGFSPEETRAIIAKMP
jgi:uncharacterized protein with GYD domain